MLTLDEAEQRLAATYRARFRHELATVVADLPVPPVASTTYSAVGSVRVATAQVAAAVLILGLTVLTLAGRHRFLAVVLAGLGVLAVGMFVLAAGGDLLGGDEHGAELGAAGRP